MAALRETLSAAGLTDVRTHIQSGNVVYEPPAGTKDDAGLITDLIERDFGFAPVVISLGAGELARHVAASPFADEDPAKAFVVFFRGDAAAIGELLTLAANGEVAKVVDGVVHLHCPEGLGRSKLAAAFANSRTVPATVRNLRTLAAVLDLADARAAAQ